MLFDAVLMVDWSARSVPSPVAPSPDAVWIGSAGAARTHPRYFRTRAAGWAYLVERLVELRAGGRRVLVGMDFPLGYPRGFAAAVAGRAEAPALWARLTELIEDGADNGNNRYEVAAELNRKFGGTGPFWGRPRQLALAGLPETKADPGLWGFPEFRAAERAAPGAKSCWQLAYAGSVGSQALLGLPMVQGLRAHPVLGPELAVWPFDGGLAVPEAPLVLAEVYPSAFGRAAFGDDPIRDRAQVAVAAEAYARLDAEGTLAAMFAPALPEDERQVVAAEEGWILGVEDRPALERAGLAVAAAAGGAERALRDDCFALPPGIEWVPVDVALAQLRDGLAPVAAVEAVPVEACAGRILAEDAVARRANPPVANAAVDGYGFAHGALAPGPHLLPLAPGRAAAGAPLGGVVPAGHAVRILTGAALPAGVDTVVLEEDTRLEAAHVAFDGAPKPRANTRPEGEDVAAGAAVLAAGRLLGPQDVALAVATGIDRLRVRRTLRVAVLSTGDELRQAGEAAEAHQIYDANRPMLAGLLRRWGMEPVDLGAAPDSAEAVVRALDRGAAEADAILTSGGASAGDEDHVSRALRERGALRTWRVAVKPGRPLALGLWRGVPVFGLPGNPVAAFVCTLVFARPALMRLAGAPWREPQGFLLPAAFSKAKKAGRREFLRARPTEDGRVEVFRSEGSGRISGLSWAEGLVELPDAALDVVPGMPVRYVPFASFGV